LSAEFRVIVCVAGASGFLGAHVAARLAAEGHSVVCAARSPSPARYCVRWLALDFTKPDPARWTRELDGVDVLVNAIGILRETRAQTFEALHVRGPWALFDAAVTAGVARIIQISALGAAADAPADYHRTKHAADFYLATRPVDWMVVRPSLVYGAGGTSAAMFETLASLPVIPLPGGGDQRIQPVHVHDLVDAVAALAIKPLPSDRVLPVVGPRELTLREFLLALRSGLGLPRARTLTIPAWMVRTAADVGGRLPGLLLDRETLGMLERGNTGSPERLTAVLGHPPRDVEEFVAPAEQSARRVQAALRWIDPLLRFGIAIMWLTAGIVSLGLYPVEASERLLVQIGVPESLAPLTLRGAAILDIALGLLSLWPRAPRWLWSAQIALVLAYTAIITWKLPALWLEPFGPVVKNLPILALLMLMRELRIRR
jgi:uncharacterized protein YbjT (DUF2867 family)